MSEAVGVATSVPSIDASRVHPTIRAERSVIDRHGIAIALASARKPWPVTSTAYHSAAGDATSMVTLPPSLLDRRARVRGSSPIGVDSPRRGQRVGESRGVASSEKRRDEKGLLM